MEPVNDDKFEKLISLTYLVYVLQALGFFTAITGIAAVMINYLKLDDTRGTWLESHFRWQIRTFWFGLLWFCIGVITLFIFIGYFILIANMLWLLYRIVKGALNLNDRKPVPELPNSEPGR